MITSQWPFWAWDPEVSCRVSRGSYVKNSLMGVTAKTWWQGGAGITILSCFPPLHVHMGGSHGAYSRRSIEPRSSWTLNQLLMRGSRHQNSCLWGTYFKHTWVPHVWQPTGPQHCKNCSQGSQILQAVYILFGHALMPTPVSWWGFPTDWHTARLWVYKYRWLTGGRGGRAFAYRERVKITADTNGCSASCWLTWRAEFSVLKNLNTESSF